MNIIIQRNSYKHAKNLLMHMLCAGMDMQAHPVSLIPLAHISPSEGFLALAPYLNLSPSTVRLWLPTSPFIFLTLKYM